MGRDKLDNYESPKYKIKYKIIINVNLHFRLKKRIYTDSSIPYNLTNSYILFHIFKKCVTIFVTTLHA